ncbi:MAG: peptidylprolyl isomerase [Anaerovoracaceae bacterium]|jgi:foldase protein PrsA
MKLKRAVAVVAAVIMILSLGACGGSSDEVLAKVKGKEIRESDVTKYLNIECMLYNMDPEEFESMEGYLDYVKGELLSELINAKTMELYLKEEKIDSLPEDWEEGYDEFLTSIKAEENNEAFMKKYKISEVDLKDFFKGIMLRNTFIETLRDGIEDMEVKAKEYYENNKEEYLVAEDTELLDASHILVADEDTAGEVLDKLKSGESFESLAAEYGTDGTKTTGGKLGFYEIGSNGWDSDFEDAAVKLAPGETSGIVKTQFGYHIIRVNDKLKSGDVKTFDSVRSEIENIILGEVYSSKLMELRDKYKVEIIEKKDDVQDSDDGEGQEEGSQKEDEGTDSQDGEG